VRKIILLLTLSLAGGAAAQSDPTSRSWNQPVEPFRIIGNIYYVGASDVTSFLITTPEGHIVLDGGFVETAPMILANIERLGFKPGDVRVLLSSHAHYDHAGGLAALKKTTGATFYASNEDAPALARGGLDDPQFGDRFPFPRIDADRLLRNRSKVTLGGTTVIGHITAGHTRGCTTFTMRAGGKDVLFMCSPSVPPEYKLVGNPRYPDAVGDYRAHFATLKSLPCDVPLAAHGSFFKLEEKRKRLGTGNPFIDPEGCRDFIGRAEERFERMVREQGGS
jgi:metallo-beta-lactamase class B